jgi:hypothetical protein
MLLLLLLQDDFDALGKIRSFLTKVVSPFALALMSATNP